MKTIRRDWLRKQVEAGRVVLVGSYHFDDMTGEYRSKEEMPVALCPEDWHDRKEGVCYLAPYEFDSHGGSARQSDNGLITLRVHSNSNYTLKIKEN